MQITEPMFQVQVDVRTVKDGTNMRADGAQYRTELNKCYKGRWTHEPYRKEPML